MATSKPKGKPATSKARAKSATSKGSRPATARATSHTLHAGSAATGMSAYGRAFWSRASILSGLALGILILVQVNADRPADSASSQHRTTYMPAYSGNHGDYTPQRTAVRPYPPAGSNWHPSAPAYYAPPAPAPGYGYYPQYGPWSPDPRIPATGYWTHSDRQG